MNWLARIRRSVTMGFFWALAWAPIAVVIGIIIDPDGSMDEIWPAIGAYPGFLSGVVFAALLGIAGRRRPDKPSLPAVAGMGASSGLLVGVVPFMIGTPTSEGPVWRLAVIVIGAIALMSAISAVGSALLGRYVEQRRTSAPV
jgi:hypothetical protein